MSCQVVPIPVLKDNHAYLLIDKANNVAAAIDPVDAKRVYEKAIALNVRIVSILTTNRYWDHAGGNEDLVRLLSEREDVNEVISVFGGIGDDVQAATNLLSDQDVISIGQLEVKAYHTPCHTRGHVL
ncbi:hypothetical protein ABG067_006244 [Albugo candida]|uniref:Metallo-beta-lactamase domain-containing protein n=1 Tax=Albugo candida TaxID=65357 RepID=A0A024FVR1_9STRA|nr:unnamed protein product [Albugo candida]|eukprot:CCI11258.1 unnamed protein product [Albugo candida]